MAAFIVVYKSALYGPFASREAGDEWITQYVRVTLPVDEMASWEIRRLVIPTSESGLRCKCCWFELAEPGDPDGFCTDCSVECEPL
jgi:hypothetical protein